MKAANESLDKSSLSEEVSFRANSCDGYEKFEQSFCFAIISGPIGAPVTATPFGTPPSNPTIYTDRKIELVVDGKTIIGTPVRNLENEIDFLIEMDNKKLVLSKSTDYMVNKKAIKRAVPAYLNTFYLVRDNFLYESLSNTNLATDIGYSGIVSNQSNGIIIEISETNNIPTTGSGDLLLLRDCDWEKATTVRKYVNNIGLPSTQLYEDYIEVALDECGWECGQCSDPICVFSEINSLLGDQSAIDDLHSTFLEYTTDLESSEEISNLLPAFQADMASVIFTTKTSGNFCIDYLSIESQLESLIENPNYLYDLELAPCPNDGTVFDGQTPFCNQFFAPCTTSPSTQFRTTGVRCFKARFTINGVLDDVNFGSIFFITENNALCAMLCSNAATVAMNQAYGQTQQSIISQNWTNHGQIRKQFLLFLGRNMSAFSLGAGCVGANSPLPFTDVKLTNGHIQYSDSYDTVFIIFDGNNFPGC